MYIAIKKIALLESLMCPMCKTSATLYQQSLMLGEKLPWSSVSTLMPIDSNINAEMYFHYPAGVCWRSSGFVLVYCIYVNLWRLVHECATMCV